jgi:hypothetical protein
MPGFGSRTHSIFHISIILVVCVLAAVETSYGGCPLSGPQATYQFVGQCYDCSGTGIGLLTLQNYTLGTALNSCNFVSFTYTSNLTSFTVTVTQYGFRGLVGKLPASLPAAATVRMEGPGSATLASNANGSWGVGLSDNGPTHTRGLAAPTPTAVPTLSTAAWCALGLLLAGAGALLEQRRVRGSAGV